VQNRFLGGPLEEEVCKKLGVHLAYELSLSKID